MTTATLPTADSAASAPAALSLPARKRAAIEAAVAAGEDALIAFAIECQQRRMFAGTAAGDLRHWSRYRLWRPSGPCPEDDFSVISPDGSLYEAEITSEGVVRFPDVPDQAFIDSLNCALRAARIGLRLTTKHRYIAQHLREWRRHGKDYFDPESGALS